MVTAAESCVPELVEPLLLTIFQKFLDAELCFRVRAADVLEAFLEELVLLARAVREEERVDLLQFKVLLVADDGVNRKYRRAAETVAGLVSANGLAGGRRPSSPGDEVPGPAVKELWLACRRL